MARGNEFRPGHPLVFWLAMLVLIYGIYSVIFAAARIDDCKSGGSADQHWSYWPPGWVCDG